MAGESKTSPRRLAARQNALDGLELRKAGVTYQAIADKLGYNSPQAAQKAITDLLNRTAREASSELRDLELERLNSMLLSIWPAVRQGNYGAIDRALRIMERTARLLGLDAPAKQEITGKDGGPIEVNDARDKLDALISRHVTAQPEDGDPSGAY